MSEFTIKIKIYGMIHNPFKEIPQIKNPDTGSRPEEASIIYEPTEKGTYELKYKPYDTRTLGELCEDLIVTSFGSLFASDVITFRQPMTKVVCDQNTKLKVLVERYRKVFLCANEMTVCINLTRNPPKNLVRASLNQDGTFKVLEI